MRRLKVFNSRLLYSLIGGVLCLGVFKLFIYIYIIDKEQSEDSNLLVSLVLALIATVFIYLLLGLISILTASRK